MVADVGSRADPVRVGKYLVEVIDEEVRWLMGRRLGRRIAALVVVGVAGTFLFGNTVVAQAETADSNVAATQVNTADSQAGFIEVSATAREANASPEECREPPCGPEPRIAKCVLRIDDVPWFELGEVKIKSRVNCYFVIGGLAFRMDYIDLELFLYKNFTTLVHRDDTTSFGQPNVTGLARKPHQCANYHGTSGAELGWPAGWIPTGHWLGVESGHNLLC
jgi:hypothetical protein